MPFLIKNKNKKTMNERRYLGDKSTDVRSVP